MATKTPKTSKQVSRKAKPTIVTLGPQLQLALVIILGLTWLVSCVPLAYAVLHAHGHLSPWWPQLLYVFFPVLLLAIGYAYVGKLGTGLARLCKATILALLGVCGLVCLQIGIGFVYPLVQGVGSDLGGYDMVQLWTYSLTLVLYVFTLGYLKLQRGKRG